MEISTIESRYLKLSNEFAVVITCMKSAFLQTRLSKILNVSVDQKTRPSICFKTRGQTFETLSRAFEILEKTNSSDESFKKLGRVQSVTV